jgi:hypothetical protein
MGVVDVLVVVLGVAVVQVTSVISTSDQPVRRWRRAHQPGAHEMIPSPNRRSGRRR